MCRVADSIAILTAASSVTETTGRMASWRLITVTLKTCEIFRQDKITYFSQSASYSELPLIWTPLMIRTL